MSGYSNFVGGMSMRSAELISDNGDLILKFLNFLWANTMKLLLLTMDF